MERVGNREKEEGWKGREGNDVKECGGMESGGRDGKGKEGKGREGAEGRDRAGKGEEGLDLDICPVGPRVSSYATASYAYKRR